MRGRENRERIERGLGSRNVLGECEEKIDYGKGRKNYQRHFDLLQQSLFPLFLSLEKMQHKQQHVAFKHHVTTVWGKERRRESPYSFRSLNHNQQLDRNKTQTAEMGTDYGGGDDNLSIDSMCAGICSTLMTPIFTDFQDQPYFFFYFATFNQ